jgi:peptide/nickel transport system substrate-binding protein
MIRDAEALDTHNVAIYLELPFAPIAAHLAHPTSSIVPMNHVLAVGDDAFAQEPIGAGPFMFQELIIGDRIEMVRNENYWNGAPQIETLTFRAVPDPSTRLIEVSSGTADVATAIAPADVATAEADPNVTLMRRLTMGTDYVWMNTQQPYLNHPLVRQAINYAIDTEAIVNTVFMGLGAVHHNPVPPLAFGHSLQPPFDTNLDRARELLAEAGYPDGFSTSIWWNSPNVQRQQVAEMIQFSLSQIGIDVEIHTFEWAAYLAEADVGNHDMMIIGWTTVTGDADYALFPLFHSTSYGSAGNRGFWSTPELDALLEAGRMETDPTTRLEIYADAQAIIRAEGPVIMLRQGETPVAVNPNLRNFTLNPTLHHSYHPVWFAE